MFRKFKSEQAETEDNIASTDPYSRKAARLQENLSPLRTLAGVASCDMAWWLGLTKQGYSNLEVLAARRLSPSHYLAIRTLLTDEAEDVRCGIILAFALEVLLDYEYEDDETYRGVSAAVEGIAAATNNKNAPNPKTLFNMFKATLQVIPGFSEAAEKAAQAKEAEAHDGDAPFGWVRLHKMHDYN
jgi:hypothetical protein